MAEIKYSDYIRSLGTRSPDGTGKIVVVPTTGEAEQILQSTTNDLLVDNSLTADSGSAQGGTPLTAAVNEISTCATAGDSVTLPTARSGLVITIINNGANACDVFPASNDDLGSGLNIAASLSAGNNVTYLSYNATNWVSI